LTALKENAPTAEAVALVESWEKRGVPDRDVDDTGDEMVYTLASAGFCVLIAIRPAVWRPD
jgi:hypothetical protein